MNLTTHIPLPEDAHDALDQLIDHLIADHLHMLNALAFALPRASRAYEPVLMLDLLPGEGPVLRLTDMDAYNWDAPPPPALTFELLSPRSLRALIPTVPANNPTERLLPLLRAKLHEAFTSLLPRQMEQLGARELHHAVRAAYSARCNATQKD